jgi:hypothetical protein
VDRDKKRTQEFVVKYGLVSGSAGRKPVATEEEEEEEEEEG